jgi:four helix bundle protein
LVAGQKAMELVTRVYQVTQNFPKNEMYGLTSQIRRAAVSIPSNVAEGYSRNSRNEFHHFVGQSRGSLAEVETQIEIAANLEYLTAEERSDLLGLTERIGRLLTGLRTWSAVS